jgi:hypothetical protein
VRVGDRIVHPLPLEAALNTVLGIRRCTLIDDPLGVRWIIEGDEDVQSALAERLGLVAYAERAWRPLPMDRRHNSKIDRVGLRR